MMSLPAGYHDWAQRQGCSPWHPDEWSADDRRAFAAWKLAWFRDKWALNKRLAIARWMPHATIRSRVREDLDRLHALPPSRPYVTCSCHRFAPAGRTRVAHTVHGLAYLAGFRRT
jgi:hypothetical protein